MSGDTGLRGCTKRVFRFGPALGCVLSGAAVLLAAPAAFAQEIPRSGAFNAGVHFDLGAGVNELISAGPMGFGFYPRGALAVEIGTNFSIQVVVRMHELLETGEFGLAGTTFAPNFLYRIRGKESPWVFAVGGGVRIGELLVENELIGVQLGNDPKVTKTPSFVLSPDATMMLEFWPVRWFAPKLAIGYAFVPTDGAPVHAIEQALILTLCL